jgi:3-methylcrotonyl-CoA carboxylase alpha subunit
MFKKILIANRGEIACRIAKTAAKLGIRSVAVYSDPDRNSKHVAACDEAIGIGGSSSQESYLRIEKILQVAKASGAEAIHPGYGFLSENAEFAEACQRADLVFIGPPVAAIRAMGNKSAAKASMSKVDVPVVPGYHGENQDPEFLQSQAEKVGYPLVIKAVAGGGGKGMRVVQSLSDFKQALNSCRREAQSSFGDDRVLIEKYLQRPRHIEIQIFADNLGNGVYLFERDCSIQRRHQKIIEEAPAANIDNTERQVMGEIAVKAAQAIGYVGAGTIEFIRDEKGFYFMEMNTRLQVEHPVTELITGQDLVEWQFRIASGERLPLTQEQLKLNGHAVEARVYAEKPNQQFLPSTGKIHFLRIPQAAEFEAAPIRIDSGVREGDLISHFYDPMIAKVIVWGGDRKEALTRLDAVLGQFQVTGVDTNIDFLRRLLNLTSFANQPGDTNLIERNEEILRSEPAAISALAFATAALLQQERKALFEVVDPWNDRSGWRLNGQYERPVSWLINKQIFETTVVYKKTGALLRLVDEEQWLEWDSMEDHQYKLRVAPIDRSIYLTTKTVAARVVQDGVYFDVFESERHTRLEWCDPLKVELSQHAESGKLTAPMPGKIVAVHVEAGSNVQRGTLLLVMEAMKMEYSIQATYDGMVEEIFYSVGDQVSEGSELIRIEKDEER